MRIGFISIIFSVLLLGDGSSRPDKIFFTGNQQKIPEIGIDHNFPMENITPGSVLRGSFFITIPEGWSLYAPGAEKYTQLEIDANQGPFHDAVFSYPQGENMKIVGEIVPVYSGKVEIFGELTVRNDVKGKIILWRPVVKWQSCSSAICLLPESVTLEIPVTISMKQ